MSEKFVCEEEYQVRHLSVATGRGRKFDVVKMRLVALARVESEDYSIRYSLADEIIFFQTAFAIPSSLSLLGL